MIPYKQLSLADIFSDCQNKFENDKPAFLSLLEKHINLDEIIPISFRNHFYTSTGRTRKYPLHALLWALIIQRIFSIPTDQLLLTFLNYSKPLREFCGFTKVPDASKITRFKQDFLDDLQLVFDNLVDITEPICQAIDSSKADMTIFDSSGIEAFVTENNPKYANRIIKQLKAYAKAQGLDKSYDPYKAAYGSMPSHASANPEIKQLFINGHFCYVFKFGVVTNSLGIIRHISFYNKEFMTSHPDIVVEKKSDSPDEDKSVHDSKLLIPTLKDFFSKHPLINPKTFLGDAAFDAVELYKTLLTGDTFGNDKHFTKAFIPLNARSGLENQDYTINEDGFMINLRKNHTDNVSVTTYALLQNVDEWFTFIPKKIYVHIPELFVELKSGIKPIKSEPLLNEILIISKIISVWQVAVRKTEKPCMQI